MFLQPIKYFVSSVFLLSLMFLAIPSFSEEADMQEKYGYSLIDVPSDAKQSFYDENQKAWEESIYSERLLFLQKWEIDSQKEKFRKTRLQAELSRQKKEEEIEVNQKSLEKQRKLQEEQRIAQEKAIEKQKEKLRIGKKHGSLFDKMRDLRNKQIRRDQDGR